MGWDEIKQYGQYVLGVAAVVFFWVGVWDGIGGLPYLEYPLGSLIAGLTMISISRFIFRDADLFSRVEKSNISKKARKIKQRSDKHKYHIQYQDKVARKNVLISAKKLHRVEKKFLVFVEEGKEIFIPAQRVKKIIEKK